MDGPGSYRYSANRMSAQVPQWNAYNNSQVQQQQQQQMRQQSPRQPRSSSVSAQHRLSRRRSNVSVCSVSSLPQRMETEDMLRVEDKFTHRHWRPKSSENLYAIARNSSSSSSLHSMSMTSLATSQRPGRRHSFTPQNLSQAAGLAAVQCTPKSNLPVLTHSPNMSPKSGSFYFPNGEVFHPRSQPKGPRSSKPARIVRRWNSFDASQQPELAPPVEMDVIPQEPQEPQESLRSDESPEAAPSQFMAERSPSNNSSSSSAHTRTPSTCSNTMSNVSANSPVSSMDTFVPDNALLNLAVIDETKEAIKPLDRVTTIEVTKKDTDSVKHLEPTESVDPLDRMPEVPEPVQVQPAKEEPVPETANEKQNNVKEELNEKVGPPKAVEAPAAAPAASLTSAPARQVHTRPVQAEPSRPLTKKKSFRNMLRKIFHSSSSSSTSISSMSTANSQSSSRTSIATMSTRASMTPESSPSLSKRRSFFSSSMLSVSKSTSSYESNEPKQIPATPLKQEKVRDDSATATTKEPVFLTVDFSSDDNESLGGIDELDRHSESPSPSPASMEETRASPETVEVPATIPEDKSICGPVESEEDNYEEDEEDEDSDADEDEDDDEDDDDGGDDSGLEYLSTMIGPGETGFFKSDSMSDTSSLTKRKDMVLKKRRQLTRFDTNSSNGTDTQSIATKSTNHSYELGESSYDLAYYYHHYKESHFADHICEKYDDVSIVRTNTLHQPLTKEELESRPEPKGCLNEASAKYNQAQYDPRFYSGYFSPLSGPIARPLTQTTPSAPKKSVQFSDKIEVSDTHSPEDYDRFNLRMKQVYAYLSAHPDRVGNIRAHLNNYKLNEMQVHELSRQHTHLFT